MRRGVTLALTLGLAVLLVVALIWPGPVVRWLARRFPDVLFRLETAEPLVALTIDDSPHPTLTPRILDVLAAHDAHATFFVIGERVPGNEAIVRRIVAEGHELGNHLMADAPSARLPAAEFARQLRQTHEVLAPYGPIRWFRPGHGWFNRRMLDQIPPHGYRCAMASAYALEFHVPSARYAARHIVLNARPGAVIVLHDGAADRERTVATLRRLLPLLQRRGYRVVTLSELVAVESQRPVGSGGRLPRTAPLLKPRTMKRQVVGMKSRIEPMFVLEESAYSTYETSRYRGGDRYDARSAADADPPPHPGTGIASDSAPPRCGSWGS